MQRWILTIVFVVAAGFLVFAIVSNKSGEKGGVEKGVSTEQNTGETPVPQQATGETPVPREPEPAGETPVPAPSGEAIEGLHVVEVETQPEPELGDDRRDEEGNPYPMRVKLTPWGAGVIEATLSRYSDSVALHEEDFQPYPVMRRIVKETLADGTTLYRYPFAAMGLNVNGQAVSLYNRRWRVVKQDRGSAEFELILADASGEPVLKLTRTWRVESRAGVDAPDRYHLSLDQKIENLSGRSVSAWYTQLGPLDLEKDLSYIGDQRHVILGYLQQRRTTADKYITTADFHLGRQRLLDEDQPSRLWPGEGDDPTRDLAWAATTNRYFTTVVHATRGDGSRAVTPLESIFPVVEGTRWGQTAETQRAGLVMQSVRIDLAAGAARSLDLSIYAGPKSWEPLEEDPTYLALGLSQTIVYNLGGCCAQCTFEWLANGLFAFLGFFHGLLADWGIAIVLLVAVVRAVLHPLTKGSQVNMMKLSKQMQTLQPELEKLKKKYGSDKGKLQQETMALYREKNINPLSMGMGCLPMLLQMPIWIALYAMLYFAIELRHEPAFWGVFQRISGGSWGFLADLSGPDNFIPVPEAMRFTVPFTSRQLDAINILPILMGIVFFIQQKYMTPPNPNMTPEQRQTQAMTKWMMVILFPLMLFFAPSGLTLYILTSTAVGIVESKRVRRHVKELEERGELHTKKPAKAGGFMERLMNAARERQAMLEEKQKMDLRTGKKRNRE